jgi:hypothetical protein
LDAVLASETNTGEPPKKKRRGGEMGRDWKCKVDQCGKDFKSVGHAVPLQPYSSNSLPFFLQKRALTTHINVHHLGRRDHICFHETCRRAFGYKHLLQRHLAKAHGTHDSAEDTERGDGEENSPSEEEEDAPAAELDIAVITGTAYARGAKDRVDRLSALGCPYPELEPLLIGFTAGPMVSEPCGYVFSRAYDLRRHLMAVHKVEIDKERVDRWVQEKRMSKM